MFSTSTQCKHWMFSSEQQLSKLRQETNRKFIEQHRKDIADEAGHKHFLSPMEERLLYKQYELVLRDFCRKFQPPMPRSVVGASFNYFKRFYLNNSVMDYHPKHIVVTCVYLACKVEEFNVSISQFVANVKGDRGKATDIILNNELLLMQQLKYHLTVHNPFRPVEGLLIDIKTRYPDIVDPECLRPMIDDFLDRIFFTDACLLYAPSQIALAAVCYASNKLQKNVDGYLIGVLCGKNSKEKLNILKEVLNNLLLMTGKNTEVPQKDQVKAIEKKLEKCRNQENNPDSLAYKRKLQEMLDEEEMESSRKYARISEEQRRIEDELLRGSGFSELS